MQQFSTSWCGTRSYKEFSYFTILFAKPQILNPGTTGKQVEWVETTGKRVERNDKRYQCIK